MAVDSSVNLNLRTEISDAEVADVFDYHKWDEEQVLSGKKVQLALAVAFKTIIEEVPPCPDRTVALRKLREARMDCNSAITHKGKY